MDMLRLVLPPVLIPAGLAFVIALLGRGAWRAPLAIGLAYAAGHRFVRGEWPPLPFGETTLTAQHWRFYLALVAAVAGVGLARVRRAPVRWVIVAGVAAVAARATLDARFRHRWELGEGVLWLGVSAAALLVQWWLSGINPRSEKSSTSPWWDACLLGTGLALSLQFSRQSSNAQLAGALTAAVGALAVAGHLGRGASWEPGAAAAWLWIFGALVVEGHVFGKLPLASALVLAAHPLAFRISWRLEKGTRGLWGFALARVPAAIVAGAAVVLARRLVEASSYSYGP